MKRLSLLLLLPMIAVLSGFFASPGLLRPTGRTLGEDGRFSAAPTAYTDPISLATFAVTSQSDSNTIVVTFTEPMPGATREDVSKWDGGSLSVSNVTAFSSTVTIIDFASNIGEDMGYSISTSDTMLSQAGEIVPAGISASYTGADVYKPRIAALAQVDSNTVRMTFNEDMNVGLYAITVFYSFDHGIGYPSSIDPVDAHTIDLNISSTWGDSLLYTCTVSNVQDANGNAILGGTQATFTSDPIIYEGTISSATFDIAQIDSNTVIATFTEPVYIPSAADTGKWSIPGLTLADASEFNSTTIILDSSNNITQGGNYTASLADSILTQADEVIEAGLSDDFTGADVYPPSPLSLTQVDSNTVRLVFNEPMNTSLYNINYFYSFAPGDGLTLDTIDAVNSTTVDININETFGSEILYTLRISYLSDVAGNAMGTNIPATFTSDEVVTGGSPGPLPSGELATSSPIIAAFTYDGTALGVANRDSLAGFLSWSVAMEASANDSLVDANDVYQGTLIYTSMTDDGGVPSFYADNLGNYATVDSVGDFYMHWSEDTWHCTAKDSSPPYACTDSVESLAGERVWNYVKARFVPATYSQDQVDARVDYIFTQMNSTHGTHGYYGAWLDNSSFTGWNITGILSGGGVEEAPGNATFGSTAFNDWYFFGTGATTGGLLEEYQNLYAARDSRAPGKIIVGNGGKYYPGPAYGFWKAYITNGPIADYMTWEFYPKPTIPATTTGYIPLIYNLCRGLTDVGTIPHFTPQPSGSEAIASVDELYKSWCAMLCYQSTPDSMAFMPDKWTNAPPLVGWATWMGQEDQPFQHVDLGNPVESAPQLEDDDTDPQGQACRIYSRDYDNGTVVYRNKNGSDVSAATEVTLALGGTYYLVGTDGTYDTGSPITSIDLANYSAAILMSAGPQGTYTTLQAPTLTGTTTDMPIYIPDSLGDGPFRVVKDTDPTTDLPVDGHWALADSLYTGIKFRVYDTVSPDTDPVWPSDWVGVYHFEDNPQGGVLTDSGQGGNDFSLREGASAGRVGWDADRRVAGKLGYAYSMAEDDSVAIRLDHTVLSDDGQFGFAGWIYLTDNSTDFMFQADPGYWYFAADPGGDPNHWPTYRDDGRTDPKDITMRFGPAAGPTHGTWHMLGFANDAAGDTVHVYLDGAELSVGDISNEPQTTITEIDSLGTPTGHIGIYGSYYWNTISDAWDGYADEMFIRNVLPTADEYNALYVATNDPEGWIVGAAAPAPQVTEVIPISTTEVQIFFDSEIDQTTGSDTANYAITGAGSPSITDAKVESHTSVVLQLDTLTGDQGYALTINNVENTSGTPVATDTDASFVIRTENAGANAVNDASIAVWINCTTVVPWTGSSIKPNLSFSKSHTDRAHVYLWDAATDDYLSNEVTGLSVLSQADPDTLTMRLYDGSCGFPNNQWYVIRFDPYFLVNADGDTTVTTQGPYAFEKGTTGSSGPTLGF